MPPAWWDEVARFVDALEAAQQELFETLRQQRLALATANNREMERLNIAAGEAAQRLQQISAWRMRLLDQAAGHGIRAANLLVVLAREVSLDAEKLRARLTAVQQRFGELRREAWIHWIIAHRSQSVYAEIVDLIALGGQRSPVYSDGPQTTPPRGGVMLDAAA